MIGTCINQRYQLLSELGRGGMGIIYRAHDTVLDREVAVKILSESTLTTDGRARLLREAQAAAQLNHPNIVAIHDAGEAEGVPFIVMELIKGHSLVGKFNLDEILSFGQQVCAALEHAHAHGIIHRDLKPENILLTADGIVKLTDFGLAHTAASRLTTEGTIIGTVFYFAPEQALGQEISERTDLYALGVVLYELTTGRLPFTGDDFVTVIAQHLHAPIVPPSTHNDAIPTALDILITQLLSKEPQDRPSSASQVRQRLAELSRPRVSPSAHVPERTELLEQRPNNLPVQPTPFIGREEQISAAQQKLTNPGIRLVTLWGPGGTGKTRLSLQVASNLLHSFRDGVFLVELAAINDAALVVPAIAQVLGVREIEGHPILNALEDFLRGKHLLLLLDNFEQVLLAAPVVSDLLAAAPELKILVTSRALLRLRGEHNYLVPPLALPDPQQPLSSEQLAEVEAIKLFVDRTQAISADFALTEENGPAVAEICRRVDGLPLAIELAAARIRLLPPQKMLAQLDHRLRLLTGGARDLPERHQTLHGAIDWSYHLLNPIEQALFRRLAVFCCTFTLDAIEAVCNAPENPLSGTGQVLFVLDLLESLVDQSLLKPSDVDGETRFTMLETIREYALRRLEESGEEKAIRRRHACFFLSLAEEAEPKLDGAEQVAWLNRLELDHDNLRMALGWTLKQDGTDLELGLRLVVALRLFWLIRGHWTAGRVWLAEALNKSSGASKLIQAKVLWAVGRMQEDPDQAVVLLQQSLALFQESYQPNKRDIARVLAALGNATMAQNDFEKAASLFEQCLELFQELADESGISQALFWLAIAVWRQDQHDRATLLLEQSLTLARQTGDKRRIAAALRQLGNIAVERTDYDRATALFEDSLAQARELGDKGNIASLLNSLGELARLQNAYERAAGFYQESLALRRELGDRFLIAMVLHNYAYVALQQGERTEAAKLFAESLALYEKVNREKGIAECLAGLAAVAGLAEQWERAAKLFGASAALLEVTGVQLATADQSEYDRNVALVRAQLEEEKFQAAWAEGRAMTAGGWKSTLSHELDSIL